MPAVKQHPQAAIPVPELWQELFRRRCSSRGFIDKCYISELGMAVHTRKGVYIYFSSDMTDQKTVRNHSFPRLKIEQRCSICKSTETYVNPAGTHVWRIVDGQYVCKKCSNQNETLERPEWHSFIKRIRFKDKQVTTDKIVRLGVCSVCRRSVAAGEVKRTAMHHIIYDANNPLDHTVEVCNKCHSAYHGRGTFAGVVR